MDTLPRTLRRLMEGENASDVPDTQLGRSERMFDVVLPIYKIEE